MSVGYVFDPYMCRHECLTEKHPECPERILYIFKELIEQNLIQKMIPIKSRCATTEELQLVHDKTYLEKLFKMSLSELNHSFNSIYANKYSLECASLAAGSTLELTKNILEGHIRCGVAIIRGPFHHAFPDKASGFCFFNGTAMCAIYARNSGKRVAIVDFDVHFNDAVAHIVRGEKDIISFSIHRYDHGKFYPGTGKPEKSILSNIKNYPFNDIIAGDKEYLDVFNKKIIPELNKFNPDLIMVSAGFDAAEGDPLGGYKVTPKGYSEMTRLMKSVCPKLCLVLEGGYNLNSISKSMAECVKVLLEK